MKYRAVTCVDVSCNVCARLSSSDKSAQCDGAPHPLQLQLACVPPRQGQSTLRGHCRELQLVAQLRRYTGLLGFRPKHHKLVNIRSTACAYFRVSRRGRCAERNWAPYTLLVRVAAVSLPRHRQDTVRGNS